MRLYEVKVRLNESRDNEVWKDNVTAAEIAVLQRTHGRESVVEIADIGHVNGRSDRKERARLADIYKTGPSADGKTRLEGESFINDIFGVAGALPPKYEPLVDTEAEEIVIEPETEEVVVKADKAKVKTKIVVPASARTSPVKREPEPAELPA